MLFEVKEVLDGLATPIYKLRGSMPWTAGYYTVKKNDMFRDRCMLSAESNCRRGMGTVLMNVLWSILGYLPSAETSWKVL